MEELSIFPLCLLPPLQIPELEGARQWKKGRGKKAEGLPSISCPANCVVIRIAGSSWLPWGGEPGVGPGREEQGD